MKAQITGIYVKDNILYKEVSWKNIFPIETLNEDSITFLKDKTEKKRLMVFIELKAII